MLHLYDRASMAHALTLELDTELKRLLAERIAALSAGEHDLTDWTEYIVVEPGDTEADIVRVAGFSPLVEPIEGARYEGAGFHAYWDWLVEHDGWFEMIVTFGSTFAYVLLIANADEVVPDLLRLCRQYSEVRS